MAQNISSDKESRWLDWIRRWQQSGLGVRAFCRRHRLREASFYFWRRVFRLRGLLAERASSGAGRVARSAAAPAFVKLAVPGAMAGASAIEVVLAQGRVLRLRPGFDADLLRQLLGVLEEPAC